MVGCIYNNVTSLGWTLIIPWIFRIANAISRLSSFSSNSILTISYGNLSWKRRLIFAPPDSSNVLTAADPLPSIARSKSCCNCWTLLKFRLHIDIWFWGKIAICNLLIMYKLLSNIMRLTYCSIALVLIDGSSGLKYLYCSTSFSRDKYCFCNLSLRDGKVSLMWFVNCWLRTFCRYGVPHLSAIFR